MKFLARITLIIGLHFGASDLFAQLDVHYFGTSKGLAQSQVTSLAEDSLGYLWIGTGSGLSRFDGANFSNYTLSDGLPNNFIWDLLIDKKGLWISTQSALSRFDNITFTNYGLPGNENGQLSKLFSYRDSVFISFSNGSLGKVVNDSVIYVKKHPLFTRIKSVLKVKHATILSQNDDTTRNLVILTNGEVRKLPLPRQTTNLFSSFYRGKKLMLSTNLGLFQLHKNSMTSEISQGFPLYGYDSAKQSYIGVRDKMLVYIKIDKSIQPIKELASVVNYSLTDSESNIWLGSDRGLFKIFPQSFEKIVLSKWGTEPVMGIANYKGDVWLGSTTTGIKIYRQHQLVREFDFGSRNKNLVFFIREDKAGKLFIGTNEGLAILDQGHIRWVSPAIIESAMDAKFDSSNVGYFGSARKGLYVLSKGGEVQKIKEFKNTPVYSLLYNKLNNSFFAGTDAGLWSINGRAAKKIDLPGLDRAQIVSMDWIDQNNIILGTTGEGVFIYSLAGRSKNISVSNGLISNTCYFVLKEKKANRIWVGTERGIDYLDLNYANSTVNNIVHFNEKDGLTGLETNKDSHLQIEKQLYFGLIDGLYQFIGSEDSFTPTSGPLHLDEMLITTKDAAPNTGTKKIKRPTANMSFSHLENRISFLFNKVNKRDPAGYYYKYKLDGQDEIWSTPSPIKTATYSNLSPGQYQFNLIVTDKSGTFEYDQMHLSFSIRPAFYQTSIFKFFMALIAVILIVLISYLYYKSTLRRTLYLQEVRYSEQAKLRKEIARDFHDELGNLMARMINYVGLLRIKENLHVDIYENLIGYSKQILDGTKDFVWALDPSNDELGNLMIHLKDFGERMFSEKDIDFQFNGVIPEHLKLPMGNSRQLNLIFKEAMTNAFRHAGATVVTLTLDLAEEFIVITLTDNGKGLAPSTIESSERGLSNMKIRATRIGGLLKIESSTLFGTSVRLRLKRVYPYSPA